MASGALINVLLNLLLIPHYGGMGAAVATVVSVAVSGYLVNLVIPSTRHLFVMQSSSLLVLPAIGRLWSHLARKR
jgi:PST family polysaccharide transporter